MYDIEDRAWNYSATERLALRQSESVPILGEFKAWLDEQAPQLLPKSAIAGAVCYALNQWQPLQAFTQDRNLPIDNNDTERDLRRLTIGRKNWMFFGSAAGGEVAATMYTLIASAVRQAFEFITRCKHRLEGGLLRIEARLFV